MSEKNEISYEEVAESHGYEKVKGAVLFTNEQHGLSDIFISESEMKEYWYNDVSESWFETLDEVILHLKKVSNDD